MSARKGTVLPYLAVRIPKSNRLDQPHLQALVPQQQPVSQQPFVQPQVKTSFIADLLTGLPERTYYSERCQPTVTFRRGKADSGFEFLGLRFRNTCFDGDLHSILHRILEGHLDSEQAVLIGRFGFVRFYRPT